MATAKETAATTEDEVMVKIRLPRVKGVNAIQQIEVGHNFKNYLVRCGETVEVPQAIYNVIMDSQMAEDEAYKYADENKLREPEM